MLPVLSIFFALILNKFEHRISAEKLDHLQISLHSLNFLILSNFPHTCTKVYIHTSIFCTFWSLIYAMVKVDIFWKIHYKRNINVKRRKHHKISDLIKFDSQKQERILKFSNNLFLKNRNRKETLTLTTKNTTKIYQLRKSNFTKKKKKKGNRRPNSQFIQVTLETVAFEISSSLQELKFYWKAKGRWSVGVTGSGHPTPRWNGPVGVFPAQP